MATAAISATLNVGGQSTNTIKLKDTRVTMSYVASAFTGTAYLMRSVTGGSTWEVVRDVSATGSYTHIERGSALYKFYCATRSAGSVDVILYDHNEDIGNTDGWKDLTSDLANAKSIGANAPSWEALRGNLYAYSFSKTTMQELWMTFHLPHDMKPNSPMFPHLHWSVGNSTHTGLCKWMLEYSYARGFINEAFPATTTIPLSGSGSGIAYAHQINECSEASAMVFDEPDGLILCRLYRDAADGTDTFDAVAFALAMDLHYLSDREHTPSKRPNFYLEGSQF